MNPTIDPRRKLAPRLSAGDKRRKVRMGIKLKFEYQPATEEAGW